MARTTAVAMAMAFAIRVAVAVAVEAIIIIMVEVLTRRLLADRLSRGRCLPLAPRMTHAAHGVATSAQPGHTCMHTQGARMHACMPSNAPAWRHPGHTL